MAEEERAMSDKPAKTASSIVTTLSRRGTYNTIIFSEEKWPAIFEDNEPPCVSDTVSNLAFKCDF